MTRVMKDSGVEWIGEIPKEWKPLKIKNILKNKGVKNYPDEQVLSLYRDLGIVIKSSRDDNHNRTSENTDNYKYVEPYDLVVNKMKAWQGSVAVSNYKGIVSPAYYVCTFTNSEVVPFYIHYLLRSTVYLPEYRRLSGGIRPDQWDLSFENFRNIPIIVPSLKEQTRIVSFLDQRCIKIDETIEREKQVIEKLKSYKQSLITEAVTKGLNPDVPMKDSGIEWIGEIPEHWNLIRLRYIANCQNGISKSAEYFGTGFPFVSYGDVYRNIELPKSIEGLVESTESDRITYSVEEGDVFFTRTSETIEEIGLTSVCKETIPNATFAGFLIRVRPLLNNLDVNFSKYYFSSNMHRRFFVKEMNLVTRASLSQELLKKLPVLIPSIKEQIEIASYLDNKCSKIDNTIAQKEKLIQKLIEYKKSLIYECVTGKREV